jgi:DNA-binding NarL/FixJ family response regulator
MKPKEQYKIAIVENEEKYRKIVQDELGKIDDFSLTFFGSAEEFLRNANVSEYHLIYVDIHLVDMNGIDLTDKLSEEYPDAKIVMLTGVGTDESIIAALKKGAMGYVLKTDAFRLAEITKTFLENGSYMSPTVAFRIQKMMKDDKSKETLKVLTEREKQIVDLIIKGKVAEEVADQFEIAVNTVRNHIRNIYSKLNVKNRIELKIKLDGMKL